ncbi:MAG TPA: phospholipid carrier-dependent glycosyltransferase [Thermoanaerobaculia bacterium]|nr:phospholipid carrier-dependent glycosyltransferase [Thermoanaerobaculia bacterium]
MNVGTTIESTGGLSTGPLRGALFLAIAGQLLVVAASFGVLGPLAMIAAILLAAAVARPAIRRPSPLLLAFVPLLVLAAYPPIAFDETLYHLPYIRAIAESGALTIHDDIRFGIFPMIQELLAVPLFAAFGATATHFLSAAEVMLLGALLLVWPRRQTAGWLAAAIVLGNPAMLLMGSITYVEAGLTLFIAAGFFCLDRRDDLRGALFLAGFFLGTAAGVKYLGWFFAAAGLLSVGRGCARYLAGVAIGALPMTARLFAVTGNPLHPYFGDSAWADAGVPAAADASTHLLRLARLFHDITFAREHVNFQPPYTPLFAIALLVAVFAARKRRLGLVCLAYLIAFIVAMPHDSRYLLPLVPLAAVPAAEWLAERVSRHALRIAAIVAALPLVLYPTYWIARRGLPPVAAEARRAFQRAHVPALRALERKGEGRVVVCGAEHLKWFGGDALLGDHFGPYTYSKIFEQTELAALAPPWIVVSRAQCPGEWRARVAASYELVYADGEAELWEKLKIEN